MKIILPPHLKPGQKVDDSVIIIDEAKEICRGIQDNKFVTPGSIYKDCFAIAQPQVSDRPLRYFVINPRLGALIAKDLGGLLIINPRILSKNKESRIMHPEGCMSYPFRPMKKIKRFREISVTYDVVEDLNKPKVKTVQEITIRDFTALVFQHELEHLNGKNIWTN